MSNEKDIFRKEPKQLSTGDIGNINAIKTDGGVFLDTLYNHVPDCEQKLLAMTKLEECVMWAVKGITAKYYEEENK